LLRDASENYPAWLAAIAQATRSVHFESYIIHDDEVGERFASALIARARDGVAVRVIYDWVGDAARGIPPWRDTDVEIRGPAVAGIEHAFAQMWALMGDPLSPDGVADVPARTGEVALRIVATMPSVAGLLRVGLLVAAIARERLRLTDAYYAGTTAYVQALRAAARDGVDVRLLVPNGTDIPLLRPLSRSGYRTLLDAGVRVFEWNGPMLHAKTAVADGRWARVGSTNLNIASWLGNYELDVVVENRQFAAEMEAMYVDDLQNATEVVLDDRNRLQPNAKSRAGRAPGGGSGARAAAGLLRVSHTVGAAMTDRRVLEPVEARIMMVASLVLLAMGSAIALFPRLLAYPMAAAAVWVGGALLYRGCKLYRMARRR
jgi:cardiolipin synthase